MALTNVVVTQSSGQPSALLRVAEIECDTDDSYPTGGYSLAAQLPGATVVFSSPVPHYDGSTLRWFKIVDVSGVPFLQCFANGSGAPGAEETGATDLSNHDDVKVGVFYK